MPETRMGWGDQPSAFGQHREHRRRWIKADVGVQEKDRPAVSVVDQLDARPVDDEGGHRRVRCGVHASSPDVFPGIATRFFILRWLIGIERTRVWQLGVSRNCVYAGFGHSIKRSKSATAD